MKMIPTRKELLEKIMDILYEHKWDFHGGDFEAAGEDLVTLFVELNTSVSTGEYLNIP